MKYDYLIVGAGLFGATCARELSGYGKRVLVIEKAGHVGGAAHTLEQDGQRYQAKGGHWFHTNDARLWDYMTRFGEWKHYTHHVKATARGQVYSLPINLTTLQQVWPWPTRPLTPQLGREFFAAYLDGHDTSTVEGWCLNHIGPDLYKLLVEGYTRKMWDAEPSKLPASIIKRMPVRTTWDDRYFSDAYQGLPVAGYTALVETMLTGIRVLLGEDYLTRTTYWNEQAKRVIYTGPVDALLADQLGKLAYRSLRFEHEWVPVADYQGVATMNYPDADVPWLRIEEWKHSYTPAAPADHTLITRHYPASYAETNDPLYPVADRANQALYAKYVKMVGYRYPQVILGGRLGSYIYRDMAPTVAAALHLVEKELT